MFLYSTMSSQLHHSKPFTLHPLAELFILMPTQLQWKAFSHTVITAQRPFLSGVNSRFFSAIPLSRFSLKMSCFFGKFPVGKMHPMPSFQRQVELRRLGNQLPVLGKANSLFKLVKCYVFCLFVKLRLSPHCVGLGIKISRVIVARAKSMCRTDL